MTFLETPRFPDLFDVDVVGGPVFSTDVVTNRGGYEKRNVNWQMPLYRFDVSSVLEDPDIMDDVLHYVNAMAGMGYGFRFRYTQDCQAAISEGVLTDLGDGAYQMIKRYTKGAITGDRVIKKPVVGEIAVSGGGSYSIDYTTGIVTHSSGPVPTGWSGSFDTPVRFGSDIAQYAMVTPDVTRWESIILVELRNPG